MDTLGKIDPATRTPIISRLGASNARGQVVGFETRVNGVRKTLRIDFDPKKGAHINVEIGKGVTRRKFAFGFRGGEKAALKQVRKFNK